jgi:hypothetical protein
LRLNSHPNIKTHRNIKPWFITTLSSTLTPLTINLTEETKRQLGTRDRLKLNNIHACKTADIREIKPLAKPLSLSLSLSLYIYIYIFNKNLILNNGIDKKTKN